MDAVLQQVDLLATVASPESLDSLAKDGAELLKSICATKEMIMVKREQTESHSKPQVKRMETEDFCSPGSAVQRSQDLPVTHLHHSDTQQTHSQSSSSHETEESPQENSDNDKFTKEQEDSGDTAESTGASTKDLQAGFLDTGAQNTMENLKGQQVREMSVVLTSYKFKNHINFISYVVQK